MSYRKNELPPARLAPRTKWWRLLWAHATGRCSRIREWRYRRAHGMVRDPERWAANREREPAAVSAAELKALLARVAVGMSTAELKALLARLEGERWP